MRMTRSRSSKASIHEQAEQAFRVVWWFRTDPGEPMAMTALQRTEDVEPALFAGLDRGDAVAYHQWCGRLATLRWLDGGMADEWDGPGMMDS